MMFAPSSRDAALPDVATLSSELKSGRLRSVDLVTACLARIRKYDPWLHAFVAVYETEALRAAEAADQMLREGTCLGPLHGIPVALKDIIDIEGKATTGGSLLFGQKLAEHSAALVERLHAAGAIIVGKTHMVQLALGAWGTNAQTGTPRNPWDHATHRTPGGSSSGSAVAVAAGLVPLAIGTDTGGSVRIPAAFCGVTGFKPTPRRIDATGVMPLSTTLDSVGVFARSAKDAGLLYAVLSGDAEVQLEPSPRPDGAWFEGLRLARLGDRDLDGVDPDVRAAYEAAIDVFSNGGAQVETIAMPRHLDTFALTASSIMLPEAALEYAEFATDPHAPMDPSVRPRLLAGTRIPATQYVQAMRQRERWKDEFSALLAQVDAFATPTTLGTAIPVAEVDHDKAPVRYTRLLNLLDMCGISLPVGLDRAGLPIGIQLGALENRDAGLIAIAMAFQERTDFHLRTPGLPAPSPSFTSPPTACAVISSKDMPC